jgi:hypothetical protein
MGRENYAVARTDRTLIVADLKRGLVSEVSWKEPEVVQVYGMKIKKYSGNSFDILFFSSPRCRMEIKRNSILTLRTPAWFSHGVNSR